jgi:hypothetical protein
MRPSSSNIFHTSLTVHPSSLTARTSVGVGNRGVGSKRCSAIDSFYGTRGMEASSLGLVSPELLRIT